MASDVSNAARLAGSLSHSVSHAMDSPSSSLPVSYATVEAARASPGWLGLIGWLLLSIINLTTTILYWIIRTVTITFPSFLYTLFSASWTVTMNATTLMFIVVAIVSAVSWVVRYRILNMYSRLPPEPQRKEPEIDLFPDTHEGGIKSGLSNYLDEFLSAIKIFGYLERSVFHELTRSMQTRKLIAGETINLEEEKGFCIVVDGLVEIFVKSGRNPRAPVRSGSRTDLFDSSSDEDALPGQQKYQLLTEVRNGAPMSSLFSIMSLFTEDVKLKSHDEDSPLPAGGSRHARSDSLKDSAAQVSHGPTSMPSTPHLEANAERPSVRYGDSILSNGASTPKIPPISLDPSVSFPPGKERAGLHSRSMSASAHPDIIARATVDTTIAIIPASAFRRLIKIYPKATAHIVHVILSRFQRVTLAQAFNYLGLTAEVLQTEKDMVKFTMCQLPNILRGDALTRLKEKFNRERERIGEDQETKGIALHNSAANRRRRSSTALRKELVMQAIAKNRSTSSSINNAASSARDLRLARGLNPGDLLAGGQLSRAPNRSPFPASLARSPAYVGNEDIGPFSPLTQKTFNPFDSGRHARISADRDSVDEDNLFRASILECVFKALGLDAGGTSSRDVDSVEGSPRLTGSPRMFSTDRRAKTLYTSNAFGFIGPYDGSIDGETESLASNGLAAHSPPNAHALAHDMMDEVEIVFFPKGSVLVEQGERSPGLYYVVDGFLDIGTTVTDGAPNLFQKSGPASFSAESLHAEHRFESPGSKASKQGTPHSSHRDQSRRRSVALIKPGGLAGYIGSVSSYRSFIDVVAKTDVYVGFLPRASLERIVDRYPIILLTMAKRLTHILPRLILHIDFALEWVQVNAGQVIFHDNDESDAIYIVLNGRLRLVEDRQDGGVSARAEFGQGESIGELEVLTETARSGTLHAIRDTELVKFPRTLFNSLAQEHPNITIKISKIIASRMRAAVDDSTKYIAKEAGSGAATNQRKSTLNLRTVAILPVTAGVPVVEFGHRLMNALAQVGPQNGATSLNQSGILNHLGKHAFNKMGKLKLSQYLADLEEKYGLVVYVADTNVNSPWTQTCITQADSILLVGLAEGSPAIGEYERFMLGMKSTARKTLVLLHTERFSRPGLTRSWLRNRMWINGGHYHIQMPYRTDAMPVHPPSKKLGQALKERVQVLQAEIQKYTSRNVHHTQYYSPDTPFKGDFHRLARRLCGKSIGLVLGGGGARGISQIGIIRAMEEAGIPVDIVGGTSIGAFVGALYARHADVVPMFGFAKKFAGRMASLWRFALDLTYPSASYTTGHEFNRGIFKTFGNTQIEDFWLEYYCNTTNISKSRAEFHTSGYAWRYIRASMSLAGLLPPLCDEGSMLLDGGYVDNLTVSHMKDLGVDVIFAIDVGALDDDTPQTYGDSLSGFWAFFNRWNPFSTHPNPPTLAEIQGRLAYVSSVDALERAKTMPGCIYMRPPVDGYGTLDFGKFDEIYKMGYEFGREFFQKLKEENKLPLTEETEAKKALRRTTAPRRASI
ncbi:patatin-domain-containing protein [Trichoderma citrinoviride]|uniref:Lysophospholipase NTE1 n=1 Tax=Trichoderma citrinoviride TaxID=58853 RepID=A0A2T4B3T1_9HYPO|nr:patatin-domain-containing protein [Trichoderma citrinoviride]PTB63995.1 patatin-domain-containing protein [Trichoderma citrinoviride]